MLNMCNKRCICDYVKYLLNNCLRVSCINSIYNIDRQLYYPVCDFVLISPLHEVHTVGLPPKTNNTKL